MSVLKVGALRSPSASSNNIVLNTDGTISSGDGGTFTSNNYIAGTFTSNNYIAGTFTSNNYIAGTFTSNNYIQTQLSSFVGAAGVFTNFDAHTDTLTIKNNFSTSTNFNVGGFTVASTGVTVPSTGYYDCYVNLVTTSFTSNQTAVLRFYKNTTVQAAQSEIGGPSNFGNGHTANLRMILYMTSGQQFRIGTIKRGDIGSGTTVVNIAGSSSNWIIQKVG